MCACRYAHFSLHCGNCASMDLVFYREIICIIAEYVKYETSFARVFFRTRIFPATCIKENFLQWWETSVHWAQLHYPLSCYPGYFSSMKHLAVFIFIRLYIFCDSMQVASTEIPCYVVSLVSRNASGYRERISRIVGCMSESAGKFPLLVQKRWWGIF